VRCVAWWCGYGVGLVIKRSRVWLPAVALSGNNSGQVVHTHVPLSLTVLTIKSNKAQLSQEIQRCSKAIARLPVVLKFLKCHRCPQIVLKSAIVLKFYSFGQNVLIWTLIFKSVAIRWHLLRLKCTKFNFGSGCAPDSAGGAYSAPPGRP